MKKIAIVFGREYTSKTSEKSSQEFEESVNSKLEELEKNKYHIITIRFTQTNSGRTAYIYYNTEKINLTLKRINIHRPVLQRRVL